jgi:HEAT repeat protein
MENIAELIEDLQNPDESIRRFAAESIGEIKDESGIAPLINVLGDECVAVGEAAADALIAIGGERAAEKVSHLLRSDEANLRNFAAEILEKIGETAVDTLVNLSGDSDKDIRKYTVDILGAIGSNKGVEPLIRLLKDPDINVAAGAADSLGRIGDKKALKPLIKHLHADIWMKCSVIKSLGAIGGKEAVNALSKISAEDDEMVLFSAIQSLGKIGDEDAIKFLIDIFKKGKPSIVSAAVQAMGEITSRIRDDAIKKIGGKIHLDLLISLLNDTDSRIRLSALQLIKRLKDKRAFKFIVPLLLDRDEDIRNLAKEAVIEIKPKEISPLTFILKSDSASPEVKAEVIDIIGELKSRQGIKEISEFLDSDNLTLRRSAITSLSKIGSRDAVDGLIKALNDEDGHVRGMAALSLGRLKEARASDEIFNLLRDKFKDVREFAASALADMESKKVSDRLLSMIKSQEPEMRRLSALSLGRIPPLPPFTKGGGGGIAEALIGAIHDESPEMRWAILKSLHQIMQRGKLQKRTIEKVSVLVKDMTHDPVSAVRMAVIPLLPLLPKESIIASALSWLETELDTKVKYEIAMTTSKLKDKRVVEPLISLLKDMDDLIRLASITALGEIGDKRAAGSLEKLMGDENPEIISAAEQALEKCR